MPKTVVISINSSWNILNFRRGLIAGLQREGWRVVALSPHDPHSARFAAAGVEHVPIEIDSAGLSPLADLRLLARYRRLLKRIRPDVFLGYTAKPNVYGSLAAASLGIPTINNISGLGTAFIEGGLLSRVMTGLYRIALARSATVFFQNAEDRDLFVHQRLVRAPQAQLLPGSGIDLVHFKPRPPNGLSGFTFLLMGRLLWQKGVAEYVEAARTVRRQMPQARFQLLGFLDVDNRSAVGRSEVEAWVSEGVIEYLGDAEDVRPFLEAADCIVLPSYREGLPRALLEGAAMAKPLIATDVPGCRHVVDHGTNGLLCAVADPAALAEAMLQMIKMTADQRAAMGQAGRSRIERDFAEEVVVRAYLDAIDAAVEGRPG